MKILHGIGKRLAHFLAKPRPSRTHVPTSPREVIAATLQKGDVLLVDGTSRFSSAIKYLTQSTWSHAALYIGDHLGPPPEGEEARVLCDVDVEQGVRMIPMSTFADLHTRICRPVGLNAAEIEQLVQFMVSRVGVTYDLKNILDLTRYLIRTPVPDPMKRRMIAFGSGQPTQAICSTLIAQAFNSLRYPILPEVELIDTSTPGGQRAKAEILHIRHYSMYMPRDFDTSPFFKIVKPRIEGGFDYHALAWAKDDEPAAATPTAGEAAASPATS
jgi:hypothetical protein